MTRPNEQQELPGTETAKHLSPDAVKKAANQALHDLRPQPRGPDIETILLILASDTKTVYNDEKAAGEAAVALYKKTFPAETADAKHAAGHPAQQPAAQQHDKSAK